MADEPDTKYLNVFLNADLIGRLSSRQAELSFKYDTDYLKKDDAIKLSASFPLQEEAFEHRETAAFFSGLLPDELVRRRLARYLGISEKNTFALLKEIGGECAGAVSVYEDGKSPDTQEEYRYRVLEDMEAHKVLSAIDKRPMMVGEDDIRISGAGAQDKLIIALVDDKIAIPMGNTPSTHIIKPAIKDLDHSVFNEFFCLKLAKALKLPAPEVHVRWLEGDPYYLIERYDRRKNADGKIVRLHQEDFCQALNIPPENKYEDEGGPTLKRCFELLDERIERGNMAGINRLIFLRGVIFNFLVGNGDAHGKNFSLLYDGEAESLAPFYDIMNTIVYHNAFKAKMAMKIAGKYKFRDIAARHFDVLAEVIGFKPEFVRNELNNMSEKIVEVATKLKDELNNDSKTASPIYDEIIAAMNIVK